MSQTEDIWESEEENFSEDDFDFDELLPNIKNFIYDWMRENSKEIIENYIKKKEKEQLASRSEKPTLKREGAYSDLTKSDICATKTEKSSNHTTSKTLNCIPKKRRE